MGNNLSKEGFDTISKELNEKIKLRPKNKTEEAQEIANNWQRLISFQRNNKI